MNETKYYFAMTLLFEIYCFARIEILPLTVDWCEVQVCRKFDCEHLKKI